LTSDPALRYRPASALGWIFKGGLDFLAFLILTSIRRRAACISRVLNEPNPQGNRQSPMFSPLLLVSGSGLAVLAVEATKSSRRKRLKKRLQVAHHGATGVSVKARRGSNGFGARLCAALVPRQLELATEDSDIASIEQWAGRYFVVSSIALPFAVLGNWIPVLALPSIAILALSTLPILRRSYAGLVYQRRVKMEVVSALVLPLMIVSGYLPAAAFGYWSYFLGMLLLARAKRRSTEAVAGLIADTLQSVWIEQDGQEIEIRFRDLRLNDLVVVQGGGKNWIPPSSTTSSSPGTSAS
jgi:cation transport ATPase